MAKIRTRTKPSRRSADRSRAHPAAPPKPPKGRMDSGHRNQYTPEDRVMRTLTTLETSRVHGANGFTDWLGDIWDTVKDLFNSTLDADNFTEKVDDLYDSVVKGETEPGV